MSYTEKKQQAFNICNTGILNDVIKGYVIAACKIAKGFDEMADININDDFIKSMLNAVNWALDENTAAEAEKKYNNF